MNVLRVSYHIIDQPADNRSVSFFQYENIQIELEYVRKSLRDYSYNIQSTTKRRLNERLKNVIKIFIISVASLPYFESQ